MVSKNVVVRPNSALDVLSVATFHLSNLLETFSEGVLRGYDTDHDLPPHTSTAMPFDSHPLTLRLVTATRRMRRPYVMLFRLYDHLTADFDDVYDLDF